MLTNAINRIVGSPYVKLAAAILATRLLETQVKQLRLDNAALRERLAQKTTTLEATNFLASNVDGASRILGAVKGERLTAAASRVMRELGDTKSALQLERQDRLAAEKSAADLENKLEALTGEIEGLRRRYSEVVEGGIGLSVEFGKGGGGGSAPAGAEAGTSAASREA